MSWAPGGRTEQRCRLKPQVRILIPQTLVGVHAVLGAALRAAGPEEEAERNITGGLSGKYWLKPVLSQPGGIW